MRRFAQNVVVFSLLNAAAGAIMWFMAPWVFDLQSQMIKLVLRNHALASALPCWIVFFFPLCTAGILILPLVAAFMLFWAVRVP